MSFGGGGETANFDITVNTSGLNAAGNEGASAFERLQKTAAGLAKQSDSLFSQINKDLRGIGKLGTQVGTAFASGVGAGTKKAQAEFANLQRSLEALAKTGAARIAQFEKQGLSGDLTAAFRNSEERLVQLQTEIQARRAEAVANPVLLRAFETEALNIRNILSKEGTQLLAVQTHNTAELAAAQARDTSKIAAQTSGQLAVNAAKVSGQQRVAITRASLETIARLEKAFGATVKGIFSTTVGAIGKIWEGTVGQVKRTFTTRKQIIEGGLKNESRLFESQQARVASVSQRVNTGILGSLTRTASIFGGGFLLFNQIQKTFQVGSDFATGLRVLQVQLGLTNDEMEKIRQTAIDLGNDISLPGISALDAAQGINLMAKQFAALGKAAPEAARQTAKAAIQLGLAVKATTEEAAGAIGSAVNVFGIATTDSIKAADILSKGLSKSAGITFQDFNAAFVQAAPVVASFLKPIEGATGALVDFTTAQAVLAKQGIFGEVAGAGLKQFFLQGQKLSKDGLKQQTLLIANAKTTGTIFFNAAHQARPLAEVINILQNGLKGYTQQQRNATLSTIFGSRSVTIANALLNENVGTYLQLQASIRDSTGAAADFAAAQKIGVARALDNVTSTLDTARIKFFELVTGGASGKGPVADFANSFADLFAKILNDGGAFTAIRRGLLGIGAGLGAIVAAKVGVEVLSLLARTLPLLGTPFGLLVGLAGALGAAFFIASGRSKNFRDAIEKTRKEIGDFAEILKTKALSGLQALGKFLAPLAKLALSNVKPIADRLKDVGLAILNFLEPALKPLQDFGHAMKLAFDFVRLGQFRAAIFEAGQAFRGLGSAIASAVGHIDFGVIARLISTTLGRSIAGAGVGAVAGGLIAGPLGAALGAAFGAAVGFALPKLRDAIGRINVGALFGKFLNGVRLIGEKIAEVLFDKRTLLAAAGIAAAAGAIAVQFVIGFTQGLLKSIPDIVSALKIVFGTALKAALTASPVLQAVLAFAILLKNVLRPVVIPIFRSVGQDAGQALGQGIGDAASGPSLVAKLKALGSFAGTVVGQTLAIGLSAALSGAALGGAKSGLEKGLGIAGIAASATQAFVAGTALSGGNAGIGAVAAAASVGVSALSAEFANNAKQAQEDKDRVSALRDAMEQVGSAAQGTAITDFITNQIKGADEKVKSNLARVGFNIKDFVRLVQSGTDVSAPGGFIDQLDTQFENLGDVSTDTENKIEAFLRTLADDASKAMSGAALDAKLLGDATKKAGDSAASSAADFRRADESISNTFNQKANAAVIQATLDAIRTKAKLLGDQADTARQKIHDLLFPPSTGDVKNSALAQIPSELQGLGDAVNSNLVDVFKNANVTQAAAELGNNLKTAIEGILTDPSIANKQQDIGRFLSAAFTGINTSDLDGKTKLIALQTIQSLQKQFASAAAGTPIDLAATFTAKSLAQQAQNMADAFISAFAQATGKAPPVDVSDKIRAAKTPQQAAAIIDQFVAAADGAAGKTHIDSPPVTPDTDGAKKAGEQIGQAVKDGVSETSLSGVGASLAQSLADGITSHTQAGVDAAFILAHQVAQAARSGFQIKSPSKVFVKIGTEVTDGLVAGLKVGTSDATQASEQLADAVINAALSAQQRATRALESGRAALFNAMFGDFDVQARTAVDDAKGAFTQGLSGIASALDSAASSLFAAAGKKPGERSLAERLLVGENVRSLNLGDELGVGNRSAIQAAAKTIEDLGVAMLQQGQSATAVAKALATYRAQLLGFTTVLGFNRAQVDALLNSFGLSTSAIQRFVAQAGVLTGVVNEAAGQAAHPPATPSPAPLKVGPNPVQSFVFEQGAIQIIPPHGDPDAIALTLVNRVAAGIH